MVPNRSASWSELVGVVLSAIFAVVALPQAYACAMLYFAGRRTHR
jgi:hypothetical protein